MFLVGKTTIKTIKQGGITMKYRNRKNNIVATLISTDEKCKTAMLELEDGKTISVTESTLKRWWKVIGEETHIDESDNSVQDEPVKKTAVHTEDKVNKEGSVNVEHEDMIVYTEGLLKKYDGEEYSAFEYNSSKSYLSIKKR
jgi:transposase-like protein